MKQKKLVAGVTIANRRSQNHEVRTALTWLDLKIEEFMDKYSADKQYRKSHEMAMNFGEVVGILKFLYLIEVISLDEFKDIVNNMTGEQLTAEEVKAL